MQKRFLIIMAMACVCWAAAASAHPMGDGGFGAPDGGPPGIPFAHVLRHAGEELGLTEEQRDQIRTILESARDQFETLRIALHDNHEAIRAVSTPETYDPAEVSDLAAVQGELVAEMVVLRSRIGVDVLNVLTDEQRAELEERRPHRRGPFGG